MTVLTTLSLYLISLSFENNDDGDYNNDKNDDGDDPFVVLEMLVLPINF